MTSLSSFSTKSTSPLLQTFVYYAAFIALGATTASLGPTLPGLAENTGTALSQISFLFTARGLGYMIGSFVGGRLYDRTAGHPVMAGALVAMACLMALVPLLPLLWLLTGVLWLVGMAEGTLDVGGNTLLVWVHGDQVGPFMNGLHLAFGVGAFLSPIIIAQAVLMSGGIAWAYWVLALLMLPVGVGLWRVSSPTNQAVSEEGAVEQANNHLLVGLIAMFFFVYAGSEVSFGGWLFTYAMELGLADETMGAYLTSAFFGFFTLGRLLAIPIAARFTPRTILLTDLVGSVAGVALIFALSSSVVALWVGAALVGFAMASIFPTTLSFAERHLTITGKVTGWFFVGASIGGMSFPWIIGQLFESVGPPIVMFTILGALLAAMGLFALLMAYSRRET